MVAVALVAVLLFCGIMVRRRTQLSYLMDANQQFYNNAQQDYLEFVVAADENQAILRRLLSGDYKDFHDIDPDGTLFPDATLCEVIAREKKVVSGYREYADGEARLVDYYAHLKAKYERARNCPWLSIAPDPPPPPSPFGPRELGSD
jgi:hypothetical protein